MVHIEILIYLNGAYLDLGGIVGDIIDGSYVINTDNKFKIYCSVVMR
jgi:hypothetical protein